MDFRDEENGWYVSGGIASNGTISRGTFSATHQSELETIVEPHMGDVDRESDMRVTKEAINMDLSNVFAWTKNLPVVEKQMKEVPEFRPA